MKARSLIFLLAGIFSIAAQTSNQSQQQPLGGSCTNVPGIGSPILMIANAKQYIMDALNLKNQYTVVKYLYYALIPAATISTPTSNVIIYPQTSTGAATNQSLAQPAIPATTYRVVFSITDYYGSKYVAIELSNTSFGASDLKINKFLLTSQLSMIKSMIDPNITDNASIDCGDLKFIYSSGTNGQNLVGDNARTTGLNILNDNSTSSNNANSNNNGGNSNNGNNNGNSNRACVTANYLETANFFGGSTGNNNNGTTAADLINCNPNKNAVSAIMIGCSNNVLASLQLMFNNYGDAGSSLSAFAGNPNTPASAITTISLGSADRISFAAGSNPASIRIQTFDSNNILLASYTCGNGAISNQSVIVSVRDFLGLSNVTGTTTINGFDITQYRAYN